MDKLKQYILSELRENGYMSELGIFSAANFNYQNPSYAVVFPKLNVYISDKSNFDEINKDVFYYGNLIKKIAAIPLNIEGSGHGIHSYIPLEVAFLFDLANWKDTDISNANEDLDIFNDSKNKILKRYGDGDYDGVLTTCKSLLESLYKYILDKNNIDYNKTDDYIKLSERVFKKLGLNSSSEVNNAENKIRSGIIGINNGINELRNIGSDSHGENPENKNMQNHLLIKFVIETTISLAFYIKSRI